MVHTVSPVTDEAEIPVVVLIGAGASYASGPYPPGDRPPLTTELFSGERAKNKFQTHGLARMASEIIERDMRGNGSLAFEEALKRLLAHPSSHRQLMGKDVPLYLQELMLQLSKDLDGKATRYNALADQLLQLPVPVHFVSLNYDTLLDDVLNRFFRLRTIESYVYVSEDDQKRWSLIKPHGSANWVVRIPGGYDPYDMTADLVIPDGPIIAKDTIGLELNNLRQATPHVKSSPNMPADLYPRLALPQGPKEGLAMPDEHLRFFTDMLSTAPEINLLVLGYSGVDKEILHLIRDNVQQIRRLTVVNASPQANYAVSVVLREAGLKPVWWDTPDVAYAQWIDDKGLTDWVADHGSKPRVIEPERLRQIMGLRTEAAERDLNQRMADSIMNRPL
jgi:hypothetical protein